MRCGRLVLCVSLLIFPTLGCAFGDHVKVSYIAEIPTEKPGQGQVIYVAKATDDRPIKELVGKRMPFHSSNPFYPSMNKVVLKKGLTLSSIVTSAVTDSLTAYGYTVKQAEELDRQLAAQGDTAKILYTSIQDFWIYYSVSGVTVVDANSSVALDFEMKDKSTNRMSWESTVAQKGKVSGIVATQSLSEESLNMVFRKTMEDFQRVISSNDFKNALMGK